MKLISKLALAALLAGTSVVSAAAQDLQPLSFGTVALKGDSGIISMAAEKDFDAEEGVDIEMMPFKGDALLLKGLIAGQLDAYIGNPGGPMIAASKGADIKILGCPWPGLTYALFTKPDVASVKDLAGGSIGVSAPGALPDLFARAVIEASGVDPKSVTFVAAGSDSERISAVVAGVTTAAPSSSEFQAKAPELGLKMLVHARDVVPDYVRFCIMTTGSMIEKHPELLESFMAAELKGFNYAMDNRDETIALSRELSHLDADDTSPEFIFDEVKQYGAVNPEMDVDMKKLDWMKGLLANAGNLPADFDPSTMVDTSILEAAKAKVAGE